MTVPAQVTVGSGTLFGLAAQHYGDPTMWNRIASANGLTDPWIAGVVTLTLPRPETIRTNGGILGAP